MRFKDALVIVLAASFCLWFVYNVAWYSNDCLKRGYILFPICPQTIPVPRAPGVR